MFDLTTFDRDAIEGYNGLYTLQRLDDDVYRAFKANPYGDPILETVDLRLVDDPVEASFEVIDGTEHVTETDGDALKLLEGDPVWSQYAKLRAVQEAGWDARFCREKMDALNSIL